MILKELESLIKQIEIRKNKKVQTLRSGAIISPRAGRGLDFKEVREYILGDDTRHIDWNVSSRMSELYVKEYHQENDRIVYIFLDASASMFSGGHHSYSKYFIGFQFAAFTSLLFLHGGDRIHLCLYSDEMEYQSNTLKTKAQVYMILRKFYEKKMTHRKTNHLLPLQYLKNKVRRNSVAYIISDFTSLPDMDLYKPLMKLHDLFAIKVYDNTDVLRSDIFQLFQIQNPESDHGGEYDSCFEEDEQTVKHFFGKNVLRLNSSEKLAAPIIQFLLK